MLSTSVVAVLRPVDFQLDTGNPGAAFGLAISTDNGEIRFAAVDDNTNTVKVWTFQRSSHRHGMDEGGLSGEARMSDRDAVDNFFADLGKHRGDLD